jgi:hypothetical protein
MSLASIPAVSRLFATPDLMFQTVFVTIATIAVASKFLDRSPGTMAAAGAAGPKVRSLQIRFLLVFWLLRMADWLQGPYFYEVYASKVIGGVPVSLDLVSKLFLVGFGTTGLLGPFVGRLVDSCGRRAGTLAYAALYTVGALSVRSAELPVLLLGRLASGVGTSLLFSAPESWLVGEHNRNGFDGRWLAQTFGWAYAGDRCAPRAGRRVLTDGGGSVHASPRASFVPALWLVGGGRALGDDALRPSLPVKQPPPCTT